MLRILDYWVLEPKKINYNYNPELASAIEELLEQDPFDLNHYNR